MEYTATHCYVLGQTRSGNPSTLVYTSERSTLRCCGSQPEARFSLELGTCGLRNYYAIRSPTAASYLLKQDYINNKLIAVSKKIL